MWLAEAVATNHLLLRFPPAIMPKCSKFSNSQKFMIFGLSNILDPWPQWHKELTDGLSSKKSTKASIKHTVLPHLSGHHGTVHILRCPDM